MLICTGWAFAVFCGVVVAGPYSGAHLNPAVTVGLWARLASSEAGLIAGYILAQFIGAMLGALVVWFAYIDHFRLTDDGLKKRGVFCTAPAILNLKNNCFGEALGAFVLVFVVLHFGDAEIIGTHELIGLGSIGALPVALLIWCIGLCLGGNTGYAINPARDLGPRMIHALLPIKNKADFNWKYAWVPVVAPLVGGCVAGLIFWFIYSSPAMA